MHMMQNMEPAAFSTSGTATSRYEALVASDAIELDPTQEDLVKRLDVIALRLGRRHHRSSRFDLANRVGLRGSAGEAVQQSNRSPK
jgi:predicted ATPase